MKKLTNFLAIGFLILPVLLMSTPVKTESSLAYTAETVYKLATFLYDKMDYDLPGDDKKARLAVRAMHRFEIHASYFYSQINSVDQIRRHLGRDYRRLLRSFYRAEDAFYNMNNEMRSDFQQDFYALADGMGQLSYYFPGHNWLDY